MTKLEFIDKINDILIGLNTAESDALGSLYDELMRDNDWQQVRIQASIAAMQTVDDHVSTVNELAERCVRYADALVKVLKKGGDQ